MLHYTPRAKDFLSFCVHVELAMMIVFLLPVFTVGLTRLGITTTEKLKKNRRIGYFACGVVGMAAAPSVDPVTTTLQALPLFILYEGSIWLCAFLDRRAKRLHSSPALET
jgi:sec-independent protein translocase protein TatC